ncbi:MAG: hypothetical protein QXO86_08095 [Nitrososphaerota archaeon]
MDALVTNVIHPLVIFAFIVLCLLIAITLLKEKKPDRKRVPRNYIEELQNYINGSAGRKPVDAVRIYLTVLNGLNAYPRGAWLLKSILTSSLSSIIPDRIYRFSLKRLIGSAVVMT